MGQRYSTLEGVMVLVLLSLYYYDELVCKDIFVLMLSSPSRRRVVFDLIRLHYPSDLRPRVDSVRI